MYKYTFTYREYTFIVTAFSYMVVTNLSVQASAQPLRVEWWKTMWEEGLWVAGGGETQNTIRFLDNGVITICLVVYFRYRLGLKVYFISKCMQVVHDAFQSISSDVHMMSWTVLGKDGMGWDGF